MTAADLAIPRSVVVLARAVRDEALPYIGVRRARVRGADPASALLTEALDTAILGLGEASSHDPDSGLVLATELGPAHTIRAAANDACEGFVSPTRFGALTPASIVGATCIACGIRGPTMTLVGADARTRVVAMVIAAGYVARGDAPRCYVAFHRTTSTGDQIRVALLAPSFDSPVVGHDLVSTSFIRGTECAT